MISPDPDAPELPPPLETDSQDTDTPPVYQDINDLSCKPNKVVDCYEGEQQCQPREPDLHANNYLCHLSKYLNPNAVSMCINLFLEYKDHLCKV